MFLSRKILKFLQRKPEKNLQVDLMGGLGNQLFIYFAAKFLAEKCDKNLVVNVGDLSKYGKQHTGDITILRLPGTFLHAKKKLIHFQRLINRINLKLIRSFKLYRHVQKKYFGRYYAVDIGYERAIEELRNPLFLSGYFQTWRFFEADKEKNLEFFTIANPSKWFSSEMEYVQRSRPIGIHIRRGDFTSLKDEFGLLSADYYGRALAECLNSIQEKNIWVFSDEIEVARELMSGLSNQNFRYIVSPKESHPMESLILMSECSSLIIANSTFSYWAGMTGNVNKLVFAPAKWFKNRQDPNDLVPLSWRKIESSWLP